VFVASLKPNCDIKTATSRIASCGIVVAQVLFDPAIHALFDGRTLAFVYA
jgi:hypothetical protein